MYGNGTLVSPGNGNNNSITTGSGQGDDEDTIIYSVDNATLLGLKQYYDKDVDIQICRRRKMQETFRAEWSVGRQQNGKETSRLAHFNTERYQRLLRAFFQEAHDYLMLFGFVGYYCVKDMPRWLERWQERQKETTMLVEDTEDDELPFGVIRLGLTVQDMCGTYQVVRREGSIRQRMVFECDDEKLGRRYNFYVFDQGATFEPLQQARRLNDPDADLVVLTPFMELYNSRCGIEEARTCLFDANYMATHPESFVVAKPLPEQKVEQIPEEVRYAFDNISTAAQANNLRRIELSTALANSQKEVIQSNSQRRPLRGRIGTLEGTGIDARGSNSLYQARKSLYLRPDMKESLEVLPESMDLARGPVPVTLLNVEDLQRRYESEICSVMDFPQCFLRPGHESSGGSSSNGASKPDHKNEARLVFAQKQLEETVINQQTVFQDLFVEVYARSFGALELLLQGENKAYKAQEIRLNFENLSVKTDQAIMGLLPLVLAGVVGDDEMRQLMTRNGILDEGESMQSRSERKKRLNAATMSEKKGDQKTKKKDKKASEKKKEPEPKTKDEKKRSASSSSSSESDEKPKRKKVKKDGSQ